MSYCVKCGDDLSADCMLNTGMCVFCYYKTDEWVTPMRLQHVLDKLPHATGMEQTRDVIFAMLEDVEREANGEIVFSQDAKKSIGTRTATLFKQRFKDSLGA